MVKPTKKTPRYKQEESIESQFLTINKEIKLSEKQLQLNKLIKDNKITVVTGPPGTSKTFVTVYTALELFKKGTFKKILLCKPTVIVSGSVDLGALPGTLEEKTDVYAESFYHNFKQIISTNDLKMLKDTGTVEFKPVQYMRGCSFNDVLLLVDESQNLHINELVTIVTRLGKNSKIIFCGDVRQNDIGKKFVAIDTLNKLLKGLPEVSFFEFKREDIVRDPLLIEFTDRYEKMEENNELPPAKNN